MIYPYLWQETNHLIFFYNSYVRTVLQLLSFKELFVSFSLTIVLFT